jgi:hypothetical protein
MRFYEVHLASDPECPRTFVEAEFVDLSRADTELGQGRYREVHSALEMELDRGDLRAAWLAWRYGNDVAFAEFEAHREESIRVAEDGYMPLDELLALTHQAALKPVK